MENDLLNKEKQELIEGMLAYQAQEMHNIISSVAHDIKNPLGVIDLSFGILEDKIEPLLSEADEKLEKKVRTFMNNIKVGLERCQDILETTLLLQRINMSDEVAEINLFPFVNEYTFLAKPSLKNSKISLENKISEDIRIEIEKVKWAKSLIATLQYIANSSKLESSGTISIDYIDSKFIFEVYSMDDSPVNLNKEKDISLDIFNYHYSMLIDKYQLKFNLEHKDNKVIATLII